MAESIGFLIGGFVAIYLISALILMFFGRKKSNYRAVTVSTLAAFAIAAGLGAFGMADGGPPQFARALMVSLVPFLAVLAANLFRVKRALDRRARELATELERQEDS